MSRPALSTHEVKIHLADVLRAHHISQKQLAEAAHLRPATVNAIFHGRVERLDLSTVADLIGGLERLGVRLGVGDLLEAVPVRAEPDAETRAWTEAALAPPLDPFEWGDTDPDTLGQPVRYVPGVGLVIENLQR